MLVWKTSTVPVFYHCTGIQEAGHNIHRIKTDLLGSHMHMHAHTRTHTYANGQIFDLVDDFRIVFICLVMGCPGSCITM